VSTAVVPVARATVATGRQLPSPDKRPRDYAAARAAAAVRPRPLPDQ